MGRGEKNLHNQHLWDLFFKVFFIIFFTWEVKQKGGARGEFFPLKTKKGPIGVVEGCPPWLLVPGWQLQWLFWPK